MKVSIHLYYSNHFSFSSSDGVISMINWFLFNYSCFILFIVSFTYYGFLFHFSEIYFLFLQFDACLFSFLFFDNRCMSLFSSAICYLNMLYIWLPHHFYSTRLISIAFIYLSIILYMCLHFVRYILFFTFFMLLHHDYFVFTCVHYCFYVWVWLKKNRRMEAAATRVTMVIS